jgi:hypothetical protein
MADAAVEKWGANLIQIVTEAESLLERFRRLGRVPRDGLGLRVPRLQALLDIWEKLCPAEADNPASARAEQFTQTVTGQARALGNDFTNLLIDLEGDISRLLEEVMPPSGWIATRDFGPNGCATLRRGTGFLAIVPLRALPASHPLHELFPADQLYKLDADSPALALGPCRPNMWGKPVPRAFYPVWLAKKWTWILGEEQREAEQKAKEEKLRIERMQERAYLANPAARVDFLSQRVESLERQLTAANRGPEPAPTMEPDDA